MHPPVVRCGWSDGGLRWHILKVQVMDHKSGSREESSNRVEVHILGQRFLLKGSHDPQYVERLAAYVKRKIDEVAARGPVSSPKLAVLAALNIADDYFRALEEARDFKQEVAHKSRGLLRDLDEFAP